MLSLWKAAFTLLFICRQLEVKGEDCPSGWDSYGDKCYKVFAKSLTVRGKNWEDARTECLWYGGDLVSIANQSEQTFLSQKTRQYKGQQFWIGLNDRRNESNFEWSDGSDVTFKNWGFGEPNNFKNGEDCTTMYYFRSTWNDDSCAKEYGYVCKRQQGLPLLPTHPTLYPPATTTPLICDVGWDHYGTSCYKFSQLRKSWPSAKDACRKSGGYLVKIEDADELHSLSYALSIIYNRRSGFWIGLNDRAIEGTYAWEDGTQTNYTNWQSGEPNDSHGDEDCVEMYIGVMTGFWNDNYCDSERYYICEKPNGQDLCPINWNSNGDYCYRFNVHPGQRMPWQTARSICRAYKGADLASILTEDEHTYILNRLIGITNVGSTWIGLNDITKEGSFVWSDGSPVKYTNWAIGAPSRNWLGLLQDCVVINPSRQGGNWTTQMCFTNKPYVCKRKRGLDQCDSPLGMIDGNIGPSQITASSFGSTVSRPSQGRLHLKPSNNSAGAWCAKRNQQGEYLQIDLGLKRKITHIALQGRSSSTDFVRSFYILYGDNGDDFLAYGHNKTQKYKVFRGNIIDSDKVVNIKLMKGAFNARFVRIYPLTWSSNICLRTEIYGCEYLASSSQNCDVGWERINNTCYQINSDAKIWTDARATCYNSGGDLLSITSVAEKRFIVNRLKPLANSLYSLWIGLNDRDFNKRYYWSDFSPLVFTNWYRGNPTDLTDKKACVSIMADTGAWKDASCGEYKPFICKRQLALGNRKKVPLTGNWISGTDYYWPLNTLVNGVALGTIPATKSGNVSVTDIMALGRDVLYFSSYYAYLNTPDGEGCLVDGKECRDGFSLSLIVKFKKEASSWPSTFIVDSAGESQSRGFSLYVSNNKILAFFATDRRKWIVSIPLKTETWLHILFTWSSGAGLILYKNAVMQQQNSRGTANAPGDHNSKVLKIGSSSTVKSAGGYYMRSLAVWERDLTSSEVNDIYLAEFGNCATGWKDYGQYCYLFNRQKMSWVQADLDCKSKDSNLITINSPVEQAHITLETGKYGLNIWFWIGLHDRGVESAFEWTDGSPVLFTNWRYWQPDNWWNVEDCVHTVNSDQARWNDISCTYRMGYICRKPKAYIRNGIPSPVSRKQIICAYTANQLSCPASTVISITSAIWGRTAIDVCGRVSITNCKLDVTQRLKGLCENQAFCTMNPTYKMFRKDPCISIRKYLEIDYVCKQGPSRIPGCPSGWSVSPDGSRCLNIFYDKKNWEEARDTCRLYKAELASLHSGFENSFLTSLMVNSWEAGDVWIGLNDWRSRGIYKWTDNTTVDYSSWYTHEPHDHSVDGSCVKASLRMRSMEGKMYWLDGDCTDKLAYACKKYKARYTPSSPPVTSAVPQGPCPQGWKFFKSACFIVKFERKTWLGARDVCRWLVRGADLASIHSTEENNFIRSTLLNQTFTVWIGLNDRGIVFGHVWSDGRALKFTSWGPQQPNSVNGQQPCVEMASTGDWNDIGCYTPKPFLCRMPRPKSSPTTIPTSPPGPITTQDPTICLAGWTLWNTMCYHFSNQSLSNIRTWMDARAVCRRAGGDLVSIHSQAELNFLRDMVKFRYSAWTLWIGLNDLGTETSYQWSDGSPVDFTFYGWKEPNDWQGMEDCMELYRVNGRWNDNLCFRKRPFICKKHNNSYVPPSTTIPPSPGPTQGRCDNGWLNYDSRCYRIAASEKLSWENARRVCQKGTKSTSQGELVTINSMYENSFLVTVLKDYGAQTFWIGLNDKHTENLFTWTDGAAVTYTNWNVREPINFQYRDCAEISSFQKSVGRWNLKPCSALNGYICESPLLPVTATTSPMTGTTPPSICPAGFTQYGMSCYMMKFTASLLFTWRQANEECTAKYGGVLVSVHDPFEQAFIESKLLNYGGNVWIGLSRQPNQGSFQWSDNSLVDYTHWAARRPSAAIRNATCVQVGSDGRWMDVDCKSTNQAYMCKINKGDPHVSPTYIGNCPTGWVKFDKYCYQFNENSQRTWSVARVQCTQQGGDLLSLTSKQEKDFIVYQFKQKFASSLWIGLNDRVYERGYEWSDGSPLTYVNWRTTEPNDHNGKENCVEINTKDGKWNDLSCSISLGFICKRNLECASPLGMESGNITDDQISASSTLGSSNGASKARLHSNSAWCANSTEGEQYLQVDFLTRTRVTKVAIQGHNYNGAKFVKTYEILYSDDGLQWQTYRTRNGIKSFQGVSNNKPNAIVTSSIWIPGRSRSITARYVRIRPTSWEANICLRVEFYGCVSGCRTPLVRRGRTSISSFSASSVRGLTNNAEQIFSRGNGWCAKTADPKQWFQISFKSETKIRGLVIYGGGNSYVKVYQLLYSDDGQGWAFYTERGNVRNFRGNSGVTGRMNHRLAEPIATKFVRVRPLSWGPSGICMRMELFGCLNKCDDPFGLSSGTIEPKQLSASSIKDESHSADMGRLNGATGWIPATSNKNQYLQVNIGTVMRVHKIGTQGSADLSVFVKSYTISFSWNTRIWMRYFVRGSLKIFQANTDAKTIVVNQLSWPIRGRYFRINPISWSEGGIGLRLELYGCPANNQPTGSPPNPSTSKPSTEFLKFTGSLKVTSVKWTDAYNDKSSGSYKALASKFRKSVTDLYSGSSKVAAAFVGVYVTGFRKGSVIVSFNLTFIRDIASGTDVTKNLKNGVKNDKLGDFSVDHNSLQIKKVESGNGKTRAVKGARTSGLSSGAKAGIAITVLLLIGAGFGVGFWYFWRSKKGRMQFSHQSFDNPILFSSKAYDLDG